MESAGSGSIEIPQVIAQANFQFSSALDEALRSSETGNLVFSPFGLGLLLVMARMGANGKTATEMDKAFYFPSDEKVLLDGYEKAMETFKVSPTEYNITIANKVFADEQVKLSAEYEKKLISRLDATVELLDFNNSSASAKLINSWAREETNGRTRELTTPDELQSDTLLFLADVIYFKGVWQDRFEDVKVGRFHVSDVEKVETEMMFISGKFNHAEIEELDAKVVNLPYKGERFGMVIYVPNKISGLKKIQEGLKRFNISAITSRLQPGEEVTVNMPKFKIESTLELSRPLQELGAKTMFSSEADFSRMEESSDRSGLRVSNVVQKAFIEVTEEGTEAGAASGLKAVLLSLRPEFHVKADRPFYFQILDHRTNMITFAGVVRNPKNN